MSDTDTFDWAPFGEQRWRELAEAAGASELQLRFGVMRFGGASASASARAAGYTGDAAQMRRSGYAAVRSTAVQALLELAAVNAPADARLTDKEIDAKIARLVRSGDPNVSLKAVEAHGKRERERASSRESAWEGADADLSGFLTYFGDSRGAVVASLIGFYWTSVPKGDRLFFIDPLMADLAPHVASEFPDVWKRILVDATDEHTLRALGEMAQRPKKPISQIVLEARARGSVPASSSPKPMPESVEEEPANATQ
jgi:hypothetical protein